MTPEEREEIEVQFLQEMAHRYGEQWRRAERERGERRDAAKQRRRELAGVQTAPASQNGAQNASQNGAQNGARNAKPASQPPSAPKKRDKPPSASEPKDPAAVRRRKAARRRGARHG